MAVIQDEQGNNKPIKTDTSHVFDVNGNPLHGELFIGETIASDDVEEIDPFAHMSEVYCPTSGYDLITTFSTNTTDYEVQASGWYLFQTDLTTAVDNCRVRIGRYINVTKTTPLLVPIKAGSLISVYATSSNSITMSKLN